jgi:hypothetical protein
MRVLAERRKPSGESRICPRKTGRLAPFRLGNKRLRQGWVSSELAPPWPSSCCLRSGIEAEDC